MLNRICALLAFGTILFSCGSASAATFTVTTLVDENDGLSTGTGNSLRESIDAANATPGPHLINFSPSLFIGVPGVISLAGGSLPNLAQEITIQGPGKDLLSISGGGNQPFIASGATSVTLAAVTVRDSIGGTAGGISSPGLLTVSDCDFVNCSSLVPGSGGAITASLNLTLTRTTFLNCTGASAGAVYFTGFNLNADHCRFDSCNSLADAGAVNSQFFAIAGKLDSCTFTNNHAAGNGGAVSSASGLTIVNCTFDHNHAQVSGGAIYAGQFLTLTNCTLASNEADGSGGGIFVTIFQATLNNCTVVGNTADNDANGTGDGGGIYVNPGATLSMQNSVVAENLTKSSPATAHDIFGSVLGAGSNLVGDGTGATGISNGVSGNQVGTSVSLLDAKLLPLANNGGPTLTCMPLPASPLLEHGDDSVVNVGLYGNPSVDQRGSNRISGFHVDIGAVEVPNDPTLPAMLVDTLSDADNGIYSAGDLSLREAIRFANATAGAQSISFAPALTAGGATTITLNAGALPDLTDEVTISGPGADLLAISGKNSVRVFHVTLGTTVSMSGLKLTEGFVPGTGIGAGINNEGVLTLDGCKVTKNSAGGAAGVNVDGFAVLTASRCEFTDNSSTSDSGGLRLQSRDRATLTDCIVANNVAGDFAGGIDMYPLLGAVEMRRCTVRDNVAGQEGGGMWVSHPLTISDSLISSNTAFCRNTSGGGGARFSGTTATLVNCTIDGNSSKKGGGGLFIDSSATTTTFLNVTITGNTADSDNTNDGDGGGILSVVSKLQLGNTIIAGNHDGSTTGTIKQDVSGNVFSLGHNLIGDVVGSLGITSGTKSDLAGDTTSPINALLGALAFNGGSTRNRLPLTGSPAINAGDSALITSPLFTGPDFTDQRGLPRIRGAAVDIGAVEVQPPPVTHNDAYVTQEDSVLVTAAPGVLANDTDITTATLLTSTSHGVLSFSNTGSFTYTPAANYAGVDQFTYRAQNVLGALSNISTVQITITAENDPPVVTGPANKTTPEDTQVAITGVSVSDVDAGTSSIQVQLSVTNGRVNVAPTGSATVTGDGTTTVVLTGSVAGINARLLGLRYTPAHDYHGPDILYVDADDLGNSGAGGAMGGGKKIYLTVNSVSDAQLQISKVAAVARDTAGTTITYTIVTTNAGTEVTSSAVTITDIPPVGLLLMDAGGLAGTVGVQSVGVAPFYEVVDNVPPMAPGVSETLTLVFFTTSTQTLTNTATATSFEGSVQASATTILCPALNAPPAGDCAAFPDLTVRWTTPPTFSKGKLKGKALVTNTGTHDALNVPVSFLLSADGCPSPDDTVFSPKVLKVLKAGKSKKMNLSAKLLASPSGKLILFAADPDNIVQECDETNNLAPAGPLP